MIIPFKNSFDNAEEYDKYANITLYISTMLAIIAFAIHSYNEDWKEISNIINSINCFFILAFAVLEFITKHIFSEASSQKRYDFIDNSFDTSFSEENTKGYYTNDNIENGIYKMAVNGFENSLFTYAISKRMLKGLWIKNSLIAIVFIFLAVLGLNNAFIVILQLALPLILLNQAIRHTVFVSRINKIYENYRRLFQDLLKNTTKEYKKPEIIINVIEYEATLSWGGIILDTKIYNELNPELSKSWEEIKLKYKIE